MEEYNIDKKYRVYDKASSKGTQEKYFKDGYWYKIDNGGEGLAEELTTKLLICSNISNFVEYERCKINGKNGCRSKNFLENGETFITFQRLYQSYIGGNLTDKIRTFPDTKERYEYLINFVKECTGLDCSNYLKNNFSLDLIIMNPDRHFHNLGIIQTNNGIYKEAPIFDNGQGLGMNYSITPPNMLLEEKESLLAAATISGSFEAQVIAAGTTLKVDYEKLYEMLNDYPETLAREFLIYRLEKYKDLFHNKPTLFQEILQEKNTSPFNDGITKQEIIK